MIFYCVILDYHLLIREMVTSTCAVFSFLCIVHVYGDVTLSSVAEYVPVGGCRYVALVIKQAQVSLI